MGGDRLPLLKQRTGRRDDENAMGQPPSDELGDHKPHLDRLAEADAVG